MAQNCLAMPCGTAFPLGTARIIITSHPIFYDVCSARLWPKFEWVSDRSRHKTRGASISLRSRPSRDSKKNRRRIYLPRKCALPRVIQIGQSRAQVRPHLIQRRVPADIVGSPMRTNDLCAGFLARDAGKRFPGLWFRRVAGQSSEVGVFLYGEITRLTCQCYRRRESAHRWRRKQRRGGQPSMDPVFRSCLSVGRS